MEMGNAEISKWTHYLPSTNQVVHKLFWAQLCPRKPSYKVGTCMSLRRSPAVLQFGLDSPVTLTLGQVHNNLKKKKKKKKKLVQKC